MKQTIGIVLGLAALAACGGGETRSGEVTQRQRDSAVAASGLPGAGGVGRALQIADSAAARQRAAEAIDP